MRDLIKYGAPLILVIVATPLASSIGLIATTLLYGFAALYLFNLDNPHPSFKKHVSIALILWVLLFQLRKEYYLIIDHWVPALGAATLAFIYFQRFRAREDKHWVDYLKLIGIIALVPATYLDSMLASIITSFICLFLCLTFLLDRLIIRRQMNKTTQIFLFIIMALICLSFMIYAFIKADEANKASEEARISMLESEKLRDEAVNLMEVAQKAMAEAKRQEAISLELKVALEACKGGQ